MAHHVIEYQSITPEVVAEEARPTKSGWWVVCSGCDNLIYVPRARWQPTDYTKGVNDATPEIEIRLLLPPARLCKACS